MYKYITILVILSIPPLSFSAPAVASMTTTGDCSPIIVRSSKVRVICGLPASLVRKMIDKGYMASRRETRRLRQEIASLKRLLRRTLNRKPANENRWRKTYRKRHLLYTKLHKRLEKLESETKQHDKSFQKKIRLARNMIQHYKSRSSSSSGNNGKVLLNNIMKGQVSRNISFLKQHIKTLRNTIKPDKTLLSAALFQLANNYFILARESDSIKVYEEAIRLAPDIKKYRVSAAVAYNNRGASYSEKDKPGLAIQDLTRAIELDPKLAESYYNRGVVYAKQRKIRLAHRDYSRAIELNPLMYNAYTNRGLLYYDANRFVHALQDFNKAISLNSRIPRAFNGRGLVYSKTLHYGKAVRDFSWAIKLKPDYHWSYSNRAFVYSRMRKYDRAIADYNRAITLRPDFSIAYSNRGMSYAYKRQYDNAIRDFTSAIRLEPEKARNYYNRGVIYYELEKSLVKKEKTCSDLNRACNMAYAAACQVRQKVCPAR